MIFRKFGGSYQYWVSTPDDLLGVLDLDPALWAALSVPTNSINADKKFLNYLDCDANGIIRLGDVTTAITFITSALKSLAPLTDETTEVAVDDLNNNTEYGKELIEFINTHSEVVKDGKVRLELVTTKLNQVTSGALHGDGIVRMPAVAGSGAEELFNAILGINGSPDGITLPQLTKFTTDATDFLNWATETEKPLFRGNDPITYFTASENLKEKIEEFFRFCELIRLDPANQRRFQLNPENLPELDLKDKNAVIAALRNAPLASPDSSAELHLKGEVNPCYRSAMAEFSELFGIDSLTPESWADIQAELAPYAGYLAKAQGDNIGKIGAEKLSSCLAGNQVGILKEIFEKDGKIGDILNHLRALEKTILFKKYLLRFTNNFVCFKALFSENETSMIQAGKLIMDGRTFALSLWINNVAAHKAIAAKSHLCLIYLELINANGGKCFVATAVTAGDLKRIYIGKPAFFIDTEGNQYCGKVIDLVVGVISFWQSVTSPFKRLGNAIGNKVNKLTDFSSTEKQLGKNIDNTANQLSSGKPVPQTAAKSSMLSNGSMLLLAGGLSIAAIGAAFSYMARTIASIINSMANMPPLKLVLWIVIVLAIFFTPLAINALLQLRRRNLTLFLEATGWAVNLPMRMNAKVSKLFTFNGIYPENAAFQKLNIEVKRSKYRKITILAFIVLLLLLLLAGTSIYCRYFCCTTKCAVAAKTNEKQNISAEKTAPATKISQPKTK